MSVGYMFQPPTEQQKNIRPTNDKTHKAPYLLTSSREHTYWNQAENTKKYIKKQGTVMASTYDRSPYRIQHHIKVNTAILIFTLINKHKHFM